MNQLDLFLNRNLVLLCIDVDRQLSLLRVAARKPCVLYLGKLGQFLGMDQRSCQISVSMGLCHMHGADSLDFTSWSLRSIDTNHIWICPQIKFHKPNFSSRGRQPLGNRLVCLHVPFNPIYTTIIQYGMDKRFILRPLSCEVPITLSNVDKHGSCTVNRVGCMRSTGLDGVLSRK